MISEYSAVVRLVASSTTPAATVVISVPLRVPSARTFTLAVVRSWPVVAGSGAATLAASRVRYELEIQRAEP